MNKEPTQKQLKYIRFIQSMLCYAGSRHLGMEKMNELDDSYEEQWLNENGLNFVGSSLTEASQYISKHKDVAHATRKIFMEDMDVFELKQRIANFRSVEIEFLRTAFEPVTQFFGNGESITHFDSNDSSDGLPMDFINCSDDMI